LRIIITAALLLINFILQTTLLPLVAIRNIVPHTALIIVISYALLRSSKEGAIVGLFSGLLQDVFFSTIMGYFSIIFCAIGYFFGRNQKHFYRENYILPVFFCILGAIVYETILFLGVAISSREMHTFHFIWRILLPQIVYTAIVTIPIYRILFGINEWLEVKEKYKHRLF